jgi:hypothetical protein
MIRLHRNIRVHAFDVEGSVARSQQRPELLAVAQLAHDHPNGLTPELLANELIGSQVVLCRRIIERCVALGLLEQTQPRGPARLSVLGGQMLRLGQVLVPEQGEWRVYFAVDPLVDVAVVHMRPLEGANAREQRDQLRRERNEGQRQETVKCPPYAEQLLGKLCTSIVDGSTFQLLDLAKQGARGPTSQVRLDLEQAPDTEPRVTLRGRLENSLAVEHRLALPRAFATWSYEELWTELVGITEDLDTDTLEAARKWAGRRVLPVGFEGTSEAERRRMVRDLDVPKTEFEDLGEFEPTRLDGVELIPHSAEDAQRWARWLQWDELSGHRVPAQLQAAATQIESRFPLFRVQLRSPVELLAHAKTEPHSPRARTLLTPADLGLWS